MRKMFENRGMMMGAPRKETGEKSDKKAIEYNPVDDYEKKLEKVVVQKNKKKKKKPNFEG